MVMVGRMRVRMRMRSLALYGRYAWFQRYRFRAKVWASCSSTLWFGAGVRVDSVASHRVVSGRYPAIARILGVRFVYVVYGTVYGIGFRGFACEASKFWAFTRTQGRAKRYLKAWRKYRMWDCRGGITRKEKLSRWAGKSGRCLACESAGVTCMQGAESGCACAWTRALGDSVYAVSLIVGSGVCLGEIM